MIFSWLLLKPLDKMDFSIVRKTQGLQKILGRIKKHKILGENQRSGNGYTWSAVEPSSIPVAPIRLTRPSFAWLRCWLNYMLDVIGALHCCQNSTSLWSTILTLYYIRNTALLSVSIILLCYNFIFYIISFYYTRVLITILSLCWSLENSSFLNVFNRSIKLCTLIQIFQKCKHSLRVV